MQLIYKLFITGVFLLLLISCNDDEYGSRKESTPVIESAAISPASFIFGDSITLVAKVADPATNLALLTYEIVSEGRIITSGEIPLNSSSYEVSHAIYVPLLENQPDNSEVQVSLVARNVLKGTTATQITGLTGKRPLYNQLYLVTDNGGVAILEPLTNNKNQYYAEELTFDTSFRFKIAERLNSDNTIDYKGDVYGNVNGQIALINENGESAFVYAPSSEYIKALSFDIYKFNVAIYGSNLGESDLALRLFSDQEINDESFRVLTRTLENGKSYSLFGDLADARNIYNPDFFERTATDKVTFLGKTGEYSIYYNTVRKNIFVGVDNPSYPDYLLACGWGLGYPTNIPTEEIDAVYNDHKRVHTAWGFDDVMKYVLLRRIEDGVYQGTFYTPGDHDHYAGFKPYENTGWGNEKKADEFTFTGEQIISGDDNWEISNGENDPVIESANYRFTINLNDNIVHIEKVIL